MSGGGEFVGANFVRDKAVVRPAIPPPRMVMRSGLLVDIVDGMLNLDKEYRL